MRSARRFHERECVIVDQGIIFFYIGLLLAKRLFRLKVEIKLQVAARLKSVFGRKAKRWRRNAPSQVCPLGSAGDHSKLVIV